MSIYYLHSSFFLKSFDLPITIGKWKTQKFPVVSSDELFWLVFLVLPVFLYFADFRFSVNKSLTLIKFSNYIIYLPVKYYWDADGFGADFFGLVSAAVVNVTSC